MKIRSFLVALAALCLALPLHAQPNVPPAPRTETKAPIPMIDPQAKELVDAMVARYQKLHSYSDTVRVDLEGGAGMPTEFRRGFPVEGKLAWERPARFRLEGTTGTKAFLAMSDESTIHALSPEHPGYYIERRQFETVTEHPDGTTTPNGSQLNNAAMEANVPALGMAWMTETQFWTRTLEDVTVVALEADADTEGQACRVVNIQAQGDARETSLIRLWIAKADGLLRRMELTSILPGGAFKMIETHSQIKLNPALPAATWAWVAPPKSKPVEVFSSLNPHEFDPTIKVGDALPVFSGDALDGKPLELNSKSGKATLVVFFSLGMGPTDLLSAQGLQKKLGADKLQVVAVSEGGRRDRLEKLLADNKLTVPVYFEETGLGNRVTQLLGVRSWPTALLFDQGGKLAVIDRSARSPEMLAALHKLFPTTTEDALQQAMNNAMGFETAPTP